jgi:hypothetical protein
MGGTNEGQAPNLLDVVELREPCGGQPAGAVGDVVELFSTEALVEIAEEHGRTVEVPDRPIRSTSHPRIPGGRSPRRRIARLRRSATQRDSQRGHICIIGCICVSRAIEPSSRGDRQATDGGCRDGVPSRADP